MSQTYPMALVTAPGKVEFQERILPEFGAKDVLIQLKVAAICGSDLHIFKGRHPSAALPVSIGHEAAGQIIAIGRDVSKHNIGDRVTIEPVIACGKCEYCRRGQYHLCAKISFQYRKGQGAFATYFIASEERVFKLPDSLSYEEGALVEPLSVALHAVKKSGLRLGQTCAVFGAGAIGLLVSILARRACGNQVFVSDINPFRLEKALEFGATNVINSRSDDPVETILAKTAQMGVDHSFEAVGLETTLLQALKALKKGGAATLLGIFENPDVVVPVNLFVQREISLAGSQGYCWDFQDSLALLENGAVNLKQLITHRIALDELQQGFEVLMNPKSNAIKVVLKIDENFSA
jgi:2-desacetyl-2-hydroxyethyl bacteriochlorophyllide A dehydrogenase